MLKRSVQVNGMHSVGLTKLDVLDQLATIQLCTQYRCGEEILDIPPQEPERLAQCVPVYQDFPGWQQSTQGVTDWDALPQQARDYVLAIERALGVPISLVSTGPERDSVVERQAIFSSE